MAVITATHGVNQIATVVDLSIVLACYVQCYRICLYRSLPGYLAPAARHPAQLRTGLQA